MTWVRIPAGAFLSFRRLVDFGHVLTEDRSITTGNYVGKYVWNSLLSGVLLASLQRGDEADRKLTFRTDPTFDKLAAQSDRVDLLPRTNF